MRVYIASHSQERARGLKGLLESAGHSVVSRWIEVDTKFGQGAAAYADTERTDLATMDEADVRTAEALVLIAEEPGRMVPGGKHVETGIAIALGRPIYVLGSRENLFHWHPLVTIVNSTDELMHSLGCCGSNAPGPTA